MPVPLILAAVSHTTGIWWLVRFAKTRNISKANKQFSADWDKISLFGKSGLALAQAIYDLNGIESARTDFHGFVEKIAISKMLIAKIPKDIRAKLERVSNISTKIEYESGLAYVQYCVQRVNAERKKPSVCLADSYHALYAGGRTGIPLNRQFCDQLRQRLIALHKARRENYNKHIADILSSLSTSNKQRLVDELKIHPIIKRLGIDPRYIVQAFMPDLQQGLTNTGIADELIQRFKKPDTA